MMRWVLLALCLAPGFAWGWGDGFVLAPVLVPGAQAVRAAALNESGQIALSASVDGVTRGFVLGGGGVREISAPAGCVAAPGGDCGPVPVAMNRGGVVAGYYRPAADRIAGFVWQNGQYLAAGFDLGSELRASVAPVAISDTNLIAYDRYNGTDAVPVWGALRAPRVGQAFGVPLGVFNINNAGDVAGVMQLSITPSVTFADVILRAADGRMVQVLPPGAASAAPGFINNAGALAGVYQDAAGTRHGFVYTRGAYAPFDVPAGGTALAVQAFNDLGHVAGVWQGIGDGVWHVFLWREGVMMNVADFPVGDRVRVALNGRDALVISDSLGRRAQSFLAVCRGC